MRTSRFAIATCTALLGVGTLISQAAPASAAPPKGPKGIEIAPTTTTTLKPMGPDVIVMPPIVDPPVDPDKPIAQPDDKPECNPEHGPCDLSDKPHDQCVADSGRPDCDDHPGTGDGGTDGGTTTGGSPEGTTGGTTGGGSLPHTGSDVATYGLAGLGFIGLGAAMKRLARRRTA